MSCGSNIKIEIISIVRKASGANDHLKTPTFMQVYTLPAFNLCYIKTTKIWELYYE